MNEYRWQECQIRRKKKKKNHLKRGEIIAAKLIVETNSKRLRKNY